MRDHKDEYPVRLMAYVLEVSRSGFYGWLRRGPSKRDLRRRAVADAVKTSFRENHEIPGSRKIAKELARTIDVCRNTVARIMQEGGLRSRAQKRRFVTTTDSSHDSPVAPNQLDRCFEASAPNQKWVADITYIPTAQGWVYLAAVMDLFSRRIVGWALSEHIDTALVESALQNAIESRCPPPGLLHHSDRGVQYASVRYRQQLSEHKILCSMSRRGNCWDNAPMESFFGSLKSEWIRYQRMENLEDAHASVFRYIDIFYNRRRLHQSIGYRSPAEYEASHRSEAA